MSSGKSGPIDIGVCYDDRKVWRVQPVSKAYLPNDERVFFIYSINAVSFVINCYVRQVLDHCQTGQPQIQNKRYVTFEEKR